MRLSTPATITAERARALYRVSISSAAVAGIAAVVAVLRESPSLGVTTLVMTAAVLTATVTALRLALESAVALMKIAEILEEIAEHEAAIALNTSRGGPKAGSPDSLYP